MTFDEHPFQHIFEMSRNWDGAVLEFSLYSYKPQSILDDRTTISVKVEDFDRLWLENVLTQMREGEELAFHSKVKKGNRNLHVPLIDFSCSSSNLDLAKNKLRKVLANNIVSGLQYYDSGRSMHAYGSCLMQKKEWLEVMGALLLANFPNELPIVDSRWIGHRLMGGFTSLRWTSNSGAYLKVPSLLN